MIDLRGKRVLVTGASGLLGRPLVDKLIERGAVVRGCGIELRPPDWPSQAEYVYADISGRFGLTDVLDEEIEYIFHLAGAKGGAGIGRTKGYDFMMANLGSTLKLFEGIETLREHYDAKLKRVLFTSSVGAYPGKYDVFTEEMLESGPPHASDYFGGYAKRFGEVLCKAYREQYGLDFIIVRPTNCYGPYDRFDPETGMVIAALIARIEKGENPLIIDDDGLTRRDFLYSKDCAEGMVRALELGASGEAYNLGTGVASTLIEVARALLYAYPKLDIKWGKWGKDIEAAEFAPGAAPRLRMMDMYKATGRFGNFLLYDGPSGLLRGICETVDWYKANKNYQKYDPFKA